MNKEFYKENNQIWYIKNPACPIPGLTHFGDVANIQVNKTEEEQVNSNKVNAQDM